MVLHFHGHRKRLKQKAKQNIESLYDYELFELMLFFVIPRVDVKPLAKEFFLNNKTFEDFFNYECIDTNKNFKLSSINILYKVLYATKELLINYNKIYQHSFEYLLNSTNSTINYLNFTHSYNIQSKFIFLNRQNYLIQDDTTYNFIPQDINKKYYTVLNQKTKSGSVKQKCILNNNEIIKRALIYGASKLIIINYYKIDEAEIQAARNKILKQQKLSAKYDKESNLILNSFDSEATKQDKYLQYNKVCSDINVSYNLHNKSNTNYTFNRDIFKNDSNDKNQSVNNDLNDKNQVAVNKNGAKHKSDNINNDQRIKQKHYDNNQINNNNQDYINCANVAIVHSKASEHFDVNKNFHYKTFNIMLDQYNENMHTLCQYISNPVQENLILREDDLHNYSVAINKKLKTFNPYSIKFENKFIGLVDKIPTELELIITKIINKIEPKISELFYTCNVTNIELLEYIIIINDAYFISLKSRKVF